MHKVNVGDGKGSGEVGAIDRNQFLAYRVKGGHGHGYPNAGEVFVQGKKWKRLIKI